MNVAVFYDFKLVKYVKHDFELACDRGHQCHILLATPIMFVRTDVTLKISCYVIWVICLEQ